MFFHENPNFFYELTNRNVNFNINDFKNLVIVRSHQSKKEKTKLKSVKDKFREILAITIEWPYEEVNKKYV